jgi:hypothetical protein
MDHATVNVRQWMRNLAHRLGLPAFWRWWMGELVPLVPAAPLAAVQRRRLRPVLAFTEDGGVLWEPRLTDSEKRHASRYTATPRSPCRRGARLSTYCPT